ncbi:phosphatase PAP2 family protein [Saccharopolyspora pogona]|uniref:phosphatase PAP2 family protein n=1 Tax=Saccharopolyspora pogona TaxID=333966 RepID=UPI001682143B|nr:phosphatase PAP2 family protein [Saccharopolyspora pogona]
MKLTSWPSSPAIRTSAVIALAGAGLFAGLTYDVAEHGESAHFDHAVQDLAVTHRTGWMTAAMQAVTWLGSAVVLVPLLVVATAHLLIARRALRAAVQIWVAYLGAVALYTIAKAVVERPRPPVGELITNASGASFPSGHATQAIATWGTLVLVLACARVPRVRTALLIGTTLIVVLIGASRIYLGAHWLTDVLAGYALGGAWIALLFVMVLWSRSRDAFPPPTTGPNGQY